MQNLFVTENYICSDERYKEANKNYPFPHLEINANAMHFKILPFQDLFLFFYTSEYIYFIT